MDEHRLHDKKEDFTLKGGTTLHSLKDLYGALSTMSEEEFTHHVNEHKNDFASWIEHSHGDKFLAQQLRQAQSKEEMQKAIFISMFR
jgi:hypothetical protein